RPFAFCCGWFVESGQRQASPCASVARLWLHAGTAGQGTVEPVGQAFVDFDPVATFGYLATLAQGPADAVAIDQGEMPCAWTRQQRVKGQHGEPPQDVGPLSLLAVTCV